MLICLPPAVEKQIFNRARAEGLALSDYVERLLLEDEECREFFERVIAESPTASGELFSRLRAKYSLLRQI
jgi:hypothetical protein